MWALASSHMKDRSWFVVNVTRKTEAVVVHFLLLLVFLFPFALRANRSEILDFKNTFFLQVRGHGHLFL